MLGQVATINFSNEHTFSKACLGTVKRLFWQGVLWVILSCVSGSAALLELGNYMHGSSNRI